MTYNPENFGYELVFWGDPSSMVVQEIDGVEYVTEWENKAATGSDYNFVHQSATMAPLYLHTSDMNGFPAMSFSGVHNQYLQIASAGLDLAKNVPGLTMALAFKPVYPSSDPGTILWVSSGNNAQLPRFSYSVIDTGARIGQATRLDSSGDYSHKESEEQPPAGVYWDIFRMDYQQQSGAMLNSGLIIQRNTPLSSAGNTANTNSTAIILGALPNGAYPVQMQLAEMLIWRGPIEPEYILATSEYFDNKYTQFNAGNVDYYIYVGDSNVEGGNIDEEDRIQFQVEALMPSPPSGIPRVSYNYALGGLKIEDTLGYMEFTYLFSGLFFPNARNIYMILGSGTNDIWAGTEPEDILDFYQQTVATYQTSPYAIQVYPWTTLPLGGDFSQQVDDLVELMEKNWQNYGWNGLIPAHDAVLPPPSVDFLPDNAHLAANGLPSTIGVGKVAQAIVNTLP